MPDGAPFAPADAVDVLVVSYGEVSELEPLVTSLRAQTHPPRAIRIWHNGPGFESAYRSHFGPQVELHFTGENLGYGGALNRLYRLPGADRVVVVNPDVCLRPDCLAAFTAAFEAHPDAVVIGGALTAAHEGAQSVNAYGQRLTFDLVGINTDRGQELQAFLAHQALGHAEAGSRYLGPSGALFAVNRDVWQAMGGGSLFVESLFLYLEDVALWLKIRRAGGRICFAPDALGSHAFSASTGKRSGLKLYQVERNRLWLLRALWGHAAALASLPFAALRMAAYAAAGGGDGTGGGELPAALLRAWRDGLLLPLPADLEPYLGPERAPSDLWSYVASLGDQFRDPTR